MNEQEQEMYEAELRRTSPARLPEHLLSRLQAAKPAIPRARLASSPPAAMRPAWWMTWRWLAPAMAMMSAGVLLGAMLVHGRNAAKKSAAGSLGLKADGVRVDQELVSSFDVVAKLPGGEPVRFRCRKWRDQWVVTDTNRGVEITENSPRVEVVPVRFETY